MLRLRPAARRADEFVEHVDGEVGQSRLALDCECHQDRKPAFRCEALQLAGMRDAGLAGDDAVAVGMNRLHLRRQARSGAAPAGER